MKLKWIVLIGVIALAAFVLIQWKSCPSKSYSGAVPLLSVSVNFDDLKLLNDGRSVLIPGIAASAKSLSTSWDETALSNAVASVLSSWKVGSGVFASLLLSAHYYNDDEVKGVAIDVSDVPRLLGILGGFDLSDEFLPGVAATNLSSAMLHIVPFENFASTSNFCLVASFDYGKEAWGENTTASLSEIFESAGELLNWNVTNRQGRVNCFAMFKLQDKAEILKRISQYQIEQMEKFDEENRARSQSRAAGSDDTAVEIARERQAAIRKAEEAYLRRQLYDPVVAALKSETPETQEKWKGILTTTDIMLRAVEDDAFLIYREFAGGGAVGAYTNGCRYPAPISYAYASRYKQTDAIQSAFSNLYANLEHDTRWNAASRMAFYGMMRTVDERDGRQVPNAPPSLTNACNVALAEAAYDFLKEGNWTPDEIGMAFHLTRYYSQHGALAKAYARLKAEGAVIDPWMDLMIQAQIAYRKAWDARGSGYANTVTKDGWRIYDEEMRKVFPLLEKAYKLRPDLSWSCGLALESALGDSYARELWLRRLLACRPDYAYGLSCYLFGLRPRWCGTTCEMAQFLLELARKRQFDTMVPIFAYECIVRDVFESEGGVALKEGEVPNVDKFVQAYREDFEPYFAAYHADGFEERLPFIEKVHLYLALADLAWRLENEEELLYWAEKADAMKISPWETEFYYGYTKYGSYIDTLRKLNGAKRHDFLVGVHALRMDGGDVQAIEKVRAIAEELGDYELALTCVCACKGKMDLTPFLDRSRGPASNTVNWLNQNFQGRQRDHMIFRVQLRAGENSSKTKFFLEAAQYPKVRGRQGQREKVRVEGIRGEDVKDHEEDCGVVNWPAEQETCAFEIEIVGKQARLTQNGVCLKVYSLSAVPSLCSIFTLNGFFGAELTIQKLEMEVL